MSSLRPIARFDTQCSIHHHVDGRVQARKHIRSPQEGYNNSSNNNCTIADMYKPQPYNHEGAVDSVNRDLYGIHHGAKVKDPTESINPDRARSTVETELYNIPIDLRSVYIEASVRAPLLLVTDSDPVMFMRAEDMKAEKATKKMMKYWRRRKEIFGDQAFLPLTLSGAIQDDQQALSREILMTLPDDLAGRNVLSYDVSSLYRLNAPTRQASVLKALWLLTSDMAKRRAPPQSNLVLLMNFDSIKNMEDDDLMLQHRFFSDLLTALPVRLRAIHVCGRPNEVLSTQIHPMVEKLAGRKLRKRVVLHEGTPTGVATALGQYGLQVESLPSSLGGTYE